MATAAAPQLDIDKIQAVETTRALNKFSDQVYDFLSTFKEVFPECVDTMKICLTFDVGIRLEKDPEKQKSQKIKLITSWKQTM